MFNPKYRVLITSKCFPGDIVVCLGKQLISIIKLVENFLSQHMWYGADVEAVGKGASEPNYKNIQLSMIGTDSQFVEYCCTIEQFIWGEFVCISSEFLFQDIKNIELVTEDKPFRSIGCDGVLMEIRAFDTTYFGIYSEDLELIKKIANKYNLEFECSPIYLEQE